MFDPNTLNDITHGSDIDTIDRTKLKNLQRALSWMTYPISAVDGLIGPNTRNAFAEYKLDIGETDATRVTNSCKNQAIQRIEETKSLLRADVSTQDNTKKAIAAVCQNLGIGTKPQIAYVLATVQWETAHTFRPVKEAFNKSEDWRKRNLRYYPYYGRGYVQLTWKRNYSKYFHIMREPLVRQPDQALDPEISLMVLVHGFKLGVFTGRKLTDYINDFETDFKNARRCINGLDRWREIKSLAEGYLAEL
ncbi:carboxypeptidase [uncultured Roseovarius sp.]|uniref:carboxypeptidase n=1 Tax=uncultured Roseovarius sp. TaxID=293344 RepID=UPI00262AF248|nr:carboxypeptidase [uncultured Roseovarius sp.]